MNAGELHRVLSAEAVRILAGYFGAGRKLHVPGSTANAKHLEILIGLPETVALVDAFGGGTVYLPGLPPPDGRRRSPTLRQLQALDAQKPILSARAIASRFGCSVRSIHHKRERIRKLRREGKSI